MVIIAVTALVLGVFTGTFWQNGFTALLTASSDYILYLLMFLVGISIGLHRGVLKSLRQYHVRILVIPAGIIAGSLLGGALTGLLTGTPLRQSTAIASGLGWYSLTGITITNLMGAHLGSIAFLSNLMRELFSFFSIPFLSRKNYYACIAAAGATSEDTTLPMMIRYTDEETVVISVLNGVICSAAVPVLIALCSHISL